MPTKSKPRYPKQIPKLQFQIIKEIALAGQLSNVKLKEKLGVSHSVISDAIKVLVDRGIVKKSHIETVKHQYGKPEQYYALTEIGLDEFINGNPIPQEFVEGLLKSYRVRRRYYWLKPMSNKEFESHYKMFEQKYLGHSSTHGYLVQSPFFSKLYEQWLAEYRPALFGQNHLKNIIEIIHSPFLEKCYGESLKLNDLNGITVVQKVLECLAVHRSLTEKQIEEFLNSKQKQIEEKVAGKIFKYPHFIQDQIEFHYAITPVNIRRVIDRYTFSKGYKDEFEDDGYETVIKKYLEFLSRLVIVKIDCDDGSKYELSLFGIMLILGIITHSHQKMFYKSDGVEKNDNDLVEFYSMVCRNYADKLPLVFGKWDLLTKTWDYAYRWFLPVLYQNIEDNYSRAMRSGSVTVTLGGVKEYQETMQELSFHTTARLFELYEVLSSVSGHPVLKRKRRELAALLKYADLSKFVKMLKDKNLTQDNQHLELVFNSELSIIEKALASEITFLFYINLAREKFLDYIDEGRHFLGDKRDTDYLDYQDTDYNYQGDLETIKIHKQRPIDFLRLILKSDRELSDTFLRWMADIMDYRRRSGQHMEKFEATVKKWKNQSN
jgi:DNA-binding MarR family transcriptional regulator